RSLPATHTSVLVLLHPHATPFAPHSFPTRRSSDLTQRRSTMKPMSAAIASAAITTPATMSPALPRRTSMYSPCHRTCALQVWSHAIEKPFPVGRSNRRHRGLQQFLCNLSLNLPYTVASVKSREARLLMLSFRSFSVIAELAGKETWLRA